MPNNHPHIASRVLNQPILLEPSYAKTFFSALSGRLGITQLTDAGGQVLIGEKLQMEASSFTRSRDSDRAYHVIDGVAVLPVSGTLVHKYGHLQPYSGMTGYDGILVRCRQALSDPEVKGILLDCNTPGGEVSGCFDAAHSLRLMCAGVKPLWALADDMFCSAGMAIASAAERRLITQTAIVGSVGVVMAHASYQEQLEDEGVKVTLIHSGSAKVMGNPYADLSTEDLATFQSRTDALRTEFAQLVATHSNLTLEAIMATEAATYRGKDAVEIGFADEVVNGNEAVAIFAEHLSSSTNNQQTGQIMSGTTSPSTPQASTPATAPNAGLVDEKARISGILNAEEAKGRTDLANHFAFQTDMSIDAARAALASAPMAAGSVESLGTALDVAMDKEKNPVIGDDPADGESAQVDEAGDIMASFNAATGQA